MRAAWHDPLRPMQNWRYTINLSYRYKFRGWYCRCCWIDKLYCDQGHRESLLDTWYIFDLGSFRLIQASRVSKARLMVESANSDHDEEAINSGELEDDAKGNVVAMDYAQPHRKPPIHNEEPRLWAISFLLFTLLLLWGGGILPYVIWCIINGARIILSDPNPRHCTIGHLSA